ncbi:MAG: hypothetical protein PHW18_06010 [Sulfuricurvum sp.]|uniref:Lcl domain-containing protein n=1 Tax=Sulfuricurvum sp. TaxID=2025608 RepID=UPI002607EDA5|nr:DUF1566 domain-containing protein [Sulfuricurvum sp.]MDD2829111.1 hypothetical protein [Sulfuricurvum sp.]MDD4948859.1 hypothetical protein [Sulfuricurvum sp.]
MSDYLNKMNGQSQDHDMYQEAEQQGNLEGYETYLKKYPNGMWAKEARQNISTLKAKKQKENEEYARQQKIYRQQKDKEDNEKLVFRIVIVGIVVILLYASGIFTTKEEVSPAVEEAPVAVEEAPAVDAAAVSEDAPAAESETPTNLQEYWYDVSEHECTNGEAQMTQGVCEPNWYETGRICSAAGARLPSIDELRNVVTECGGVIGDYVNNKKDPAYQKCYKNKGFADDLYWSSTSISGSTDDVLIVYFGMGKVANLSKGNSALLRCVRARQ